MKKVLLISYYYPPLNDVGSLRALGLAKHLPAHGWYPIVLTVKNPDKYYSYLGNSVPSNNNVYRSFSLFNISLLAGKSNGLLSRCMSLFGKELRHRVMPNLILIPDFASGWVPLTVLKGLRLIRKYKIDLIFATCKPNSSSVIGSMLSKITGIPLVLDFRDPWRKAIYHLAGNTSYAMSSPTPDWRDVIDRPLETAVLKCANQVTFTTEETRNLYEMLYPFLKGLTHTIYNGYMDDLLEIRPTNPFESFTIVYTGNYYFDLDDSDVFFQALNYIKNDRELTGKVHFVYIGESNELRQMFNKYDLHDLATSTGRIGRDQAIETMRRASILLLRNIRPCLSTKLFEGLATGLPLMGLFDKGEAAELIRRYAPSYFLVGGGQIEDIVCAIRKAFRLWSQNRLTSGANDHFLKLFSKRSYAEKYAKVLDRVA